MARGAAALRGTRAGGGQAGEPERGDVAPRVERLFWCASRHLTRAVFSAEAQLPGTWECTQCGNPAGPDFASPPPPRRHEPFRTHLGYVKERRTSADAEMILSEALDRLRGLTASQRAFVETRKPAGIGEKPSSGGSGTRSGRGRSGKAGPGQRRPHGPGQPDPAAASAGAAARAAGGPGRVRAQPADPHQSAPADQPTEDWCPSCEYQVTAPSHFRICLGQW